MSESDDRYQADEKEKASDEKDVEGHQQVDHAADGETDEADVEGHGFIGPQVTDPVTEP